MQLTLSLRIACAQLCLATFNAGNQQCGGVKSLLAEAFQDDPPVKSFCSSKYPPSTITVTKRSAPLLTTTSVSILTTSSTTVKISTTSAAPPTCCKSSSTTTSRSLKSSQWSSIQGLGANAVSQFCSCLNPQKTVTKTTTTTSKASTTSSTTPSTTPSTTTSSSAPATSTACSQAQVDYCGTECYCEIKLDGRTAVCASDGYCVTCSSDAYCTSTYGSTHTCADAVECGSTGCVNINDSVCPSNPPSAKRDLEAVFKAARRQKRTR